MHLLVQLDISGAKRYHHDLSYRFAKDSIYVINARVISELICYIMYIMAVLLYSFIIR